MPTKQTPKPAEPEPGMRIIQLNATNVKRLVAVEIKPRDGGGLVIIGGKNGHGKSSVLDSILFALGGKRATNHTPKVIREGEDQASVRLDLGQLVVTRTWKANGTDLLEVTTKDGHKLSEKQGLLDTLVGPLSFDPLSFANMKPADQRQTLLDLIELPFNLAELDRERADTYTQRTDVNRQLKSARSIVENLNAELAGLPTDAPSLQDALDRRAEATALQTLADRAIDRHRHAAEMLAAAQQAIIDARANLDRAEARALESQREATAADEAREAAFAAVRAVDLEEIERAVEAATAATAQAGQVAERDRMNEQATGLASESEQLTTALDAIDARKADGLAQANMPVPGLGFDDDGVTYNGLPLSQASGAETLRVSTAIAMAKAPTARIILCKDGSLLDADNMAMLAELTKGSGYQLWLERVEHDTPGTIYIEDGSYAADPL